MASIEFLTKRIEGKKAELKKLTAKMERIEKAQATTTFNVSTSAHSFMKFN